MIILIIAAIAFMFLGFFAYNPIRRKYAGIIGVGGSYLVLLGVMSRRWKSSWAWLSCSSAWDIWYLSC